MKQDSGQSLFEVVLALAITTIIIVAIVALAASAVRNSVFARNKTQASRYSQEAAEWLRGERDNDFDAFATRAVTPTWCLPSLSWASAKVGSCTSTDVISGTPFKREVVFTVPSATNVDAEVKVYWDDAQGRHEVKSVTTFTDWRTQ